MSEDKEKIKLGRPLGPPKGYLHLWIDLKRKKWIKDRAEELGERPSALVEALLDKAAPMDDEPEEPEAPAETPE